MQIPARGLRTAFQGSGVGVWFGGSGAKGSGFRVRDLSLGLKEVQGSGYSLYVFT